MHRGDELGFQVSECGTEALPDLVERLLEAAQPIDEPMSQRVATAPYSTARKLFDLAHRTGATPRHGFEKAPVDFLELALDAFAFGRIQLEEIYRSFLEAVARGRES